MNARPAQSGQMMERFLRHLPHSGEFVHTQRCMNGLDVCNTFLRK
jgi:hypothetical protein